MGKANSAQEKGQRSTLSKYDPLYHPAEAVFHLAVRGLTDTELAKELGINRDTLWKWRKKHPEFADACAKGKGPANERVEGALFRRAVGYTVPVAEVTKELVVDQDGESRLVITKQVEKMHHVPGDVTAQIFYLKNRDKENWRDRWDVNLSGSLATRETDLSGYTDEELAAMRAIHEAANSRRDSSGTS